MEITSAPKGNHYYLSNKKIFAMRNDNGAFTNKWMGVWEGENKLVDSYNYKIRIDDDEYNLFDHCEKVIYNGYSSEHHFKLPGIKVVERSFISPENKVLTSVLEFKNESPKDKVITINFEINVNNRNYSENWHDTEYQTKYEEYSRHVHVQSNKGDVLYGAAKDGEQLTKFYPSTTYNEYDSESEKQRNYSPGAYTTQFQIESWHKKEIPHIIGVSTNGLNKLLVNFVDSLRMWKKDFEQLENRQKKLDKQYNFKAGKGLEEMAYWNHNVLRLLSNTESIYAGLPWFTQHWARDTFWSLKSLLCTNQDEFAQNILSYFGRQVSELGVPNKISVNSDKNYDSLDATPLFTISLLDYINYTGDIQFLRMNTQLISALDKYYSREIEWQENKHMTWMDTLRREWAVDVLALHAKALKSMSEILRLLNSEKHDEYQKKYEEYKEKIDSYWIEQKEYYKDSINNESLTPNQLITIITDLAPKEKIKKVLEKMTSPEMLSEKGLRTLSSNDPEYHPESYHKGKAWGLTTNWLLTALLKNNELNKANQLLEIISKNFEEHAIGCLSETFNTQTKKPTDASCQLWSSSLIISAIDEELFGIKPELSKNKLVISPCMINGKIERYDKKIGESLMDLEMQGNEKESIIKIYFNQKRKLKIQLAFKDKQPKKVVVNGKESDSLEFESAMENTIQVFF